MALINLYVFLSEEINVFVIGMAGSGKSSVINIILNEDVCKSGQTFNARGLTEAIQCCKMKLLISSAIGTCYGTCFSLCCKYNSKTVLNTSDISYALNQRLYSFHVCT